MLLKPPSTSDFLDFDTAGGSTATNGNLGKVDFVLLDPDGAGGVAAPFDKTGAEIAIIADLVGATSSFTVSGSFDRHLPELHKPHRLRHLQRLQEHLSEVPVVTVPESVDRPEVRS